MKHTTRMNLLRGAAAIALGLAAAAVAFAQGALADGEVRKVDKVQGKVTLRHGPIASLEMPPMTMIFRVADAKWLDQLKEGDRVRFSAERVAGAITITAIEPAAK